MTIDFSTKYLKKISISLSCNHGFRDLLCNSLPLSVYILSGFQFVSFTNS